METFGPAREFVESPGFVQARTSALSKLDLAKVDGPIADVISGFAALPHCFTLQSCHGHFVCTRDDEPDNNNSIPSGHMGGVRYRIAYVAICIENSARGRALRGALSSVPDIDPDYVQFGAPRWFWDQWVNSYALQVEPISQQYHDEARMEVEEARHVQRVRGQFFERLRVLLASETSANVAG